MSREKCAERVLGLEQAECLRGLQRCEDNDAYASHERYTYWERHPPGHTLRADLLLVGIAVQGVTIARIVGDRVQGRHARLCPRRQAVEAGRSPRRTDRHDRHMAYRLSIMITRQRSQFRFRRRVLLGTSGHKVPSFECMHCWSLLARLGARGGWIL